MPWGFRRSRLRVVVRPSTSGVPSAPPSPGGRGRLGRGTPRWSRMSSTILPLPPGEGGGEGISESEVRQMTQSLLHPSLRSLTAARRLLALLALVCCTVASRAAIPPADASTLRHKTLLGYQGWFRCPGDGTTDGWKHWSRDRAKITPDTLTFEMWPDLSEYDADEKYPAPGFTLPGGGPAHLFSSANPKTVRRHFRWMQEHVIDGVFLQRFLVELRNPSTDKVLE